MASPNLGHSTSSSLPPLDPTNLPLNVLVDIFLASKRSLACTSHVWRAREIVELARDAVEENAIVAAKNSFVRYAVSVQIDSLEAVRYGAGIVQEEGRRELQETIAALDEASARLNDTLDELRGTTVDPAFSAIQDVKEERRCLYDFVDDAGVSELYGSIRQSMDRFDASQKSFVDTRASFDDVLTGANEALDMDEEHMSKSQGYDADGISPVPSLFYSLETHATEMASHLQGLVKHYDLCVSALRDTEGGGEIISKASQDEGGQESQLAGFGLGITRLDDEPPASPTAEDRVAMLTVIIKDAREVEDVIEEIKDRLADMEDHLSRIQSYIESLRSTSDRLRNTHHMLKQLLDQIPEYISACAVFQSAWEEEKDILSQRMEDIEGLTEFYVGFAGGYDNLIVEVHRRKRAKKDMEKLISKALAQVEDIYKQELERREDFKIEQGEFLPGDIWPGLINPPIRYEFSAIGDEATTLPDLKRDIIDKAVKRIEARGLTR